MHLVGTAGVRLRIACGPVMVVLLTRAATGRWRAEAGLALRVHIRQFLKDALKRKLQIGFTRRPRNRRTVRGLHPRRVPRGGQGGAPRFDDHPPGSEPCAAPFRGTARWGRGMGPARVRSPPASRTRLVLG